MVIKGPGGDPGGGAHVPDGHLVEAALAGGLGGGGQNGPAGVLSLELAALLIIHVDPSLTNKMEMI